LPLPLKLNSRTCYLSWHEAAGRDKGHQWMEELLVFVADKRIRINRIGYVIYPEFYNAILFCLLFLALRP
jgi:hypothetical protein